MRCCLAVIAVIILQVGGLAPAAELTPPKAGKPEILPLKDVKPGMHAIAWTVFSGMTAEPVPVEIIGVWKNAMGPRHQLGFVPQAIALYDELSAEENLRLFGKLVSPAGNCALVSITGCMRRSYSNDGRTKCRPIRAE